MILKNPRITEKSSAATEHGVYTFDVALSANKPEIARAVKESYGVTPRKVRIVVAQGKKKALVFLKKGESIQFA